MTCAHIILLDLITLTTRILGEWYKLWSSSLWRLLHSPFSSFLGPNICLGILFSNTLSLNSSLNVSDHVSQPYSTIGNIIVLYILYSNYSRKVEKTKVFGLLFSSPLHLNLPNNCFIDKKITIPSLLFSKITHFPFLSLIQALSKI